MEGNDIGAFADILNLVYIIALYHRRAIYQHGARWCHVIELQLASVRHSRRHSNYIHHRNAFGNSRILACEAFS